MKPLFLILGVIAIIAAIVGVGYILLPRFFGFDIEFDQTGPLGATKSATVTPDPYLDNPLSIATMRAKQYPGSDFTIDQTLPKGSNYSRAIASYQSDGNTIYGLLTIPDGQMPQGGWPAIVFLHGYLDPKVYQTLERYVAYQDGFARSGYVTFKPDLRGHGRSEGESVTSTYSDGYVTDALNVLASFKKRPDVNPNKIGFWGHSMGGGITLRSMVISPDIKAAVIWAGVVTDYEGLYDRYQLPRPFGSTSSPSSRAFAKQMFEKYGSPSANPAFWSAVDPYSYLTDVNTPVQLHHGSNDESVPLEMSERLKAAMDKAGKPAELLVYQGDDHNIAQSFSRAMQSSIAFFDKHLK